MNTERFQNNRDQSELDDNNWAELHRTRIVTLFQDGNVISTLTVARNIAFRVELAGLERHDGETLLERLGITDRHPAIPINSSAASGSGRRWPVPLSCSRI